MVVRSHIRQRKSTRCYIVHGWQGVIEYRSAHAGDVWLHRAFSPGFGVFAYEANGVKEDGLFTEETFRLPDEYKDHTLLMINNTDFITSPFRSFNNRK